MRFGSLYGLTEQIKANKKIYERCHMLLSIKLSNCCIGLSIIEAINSLFTSKYKPFKQKLKKQLEYQEYTLLKMELQQESVNQVNEKIKTG